MSRIIDVIATGILFYLIQSNYDCLPYCFGGSLVFVPLCAVLMLVSMHIKRYRAGITMLVILCLILLGLNKTAYMELIKMNEASKIFDIVYALIISLIVWSFAMATIAFIKPAPESKPKDLNLMNAQNVIIERLYLIMFMGIITVYVTGISYDDNHYEKYYNSIYSVMNLSLVALLHMTVMSVIAAFIISRIPSVNDRHNGATVFRRNGASGKG